MQLSINKRLRDIIGNSLGADIVEMQMEKALKDARDKATSEPMTQFYDPLSMFMGRPWLVKYGQPLNFFDLRQMALNPVIGSIVQTRLNQLAGFCRPQLQVYDLGYTITQDDTSLPDASSKAKEISDWLFTAGISGYGEDTLETFIRKYARDSLVLDQGCAEVVYRNNGIPAYFVAVDAATIRLLKHSLDYAIPDDDEEAYYVQIMMDQIVTQYTYKQLSFWARNVQTDLRYSGYGMSELEMLIRIVTTILNTEKLNAGHVAGGGMNKGVLVVKGEVQPDQFESFKRDFREATRNAADSWRVPVLNVEKGAEIDWVTLDRSNRDMEYAVLFDFLVKQACGVYQMAPEEINWSLGHVSGRGSFDTSIAPKLTYSEKKGLGPLLRGMSNRLTIDLIKPIDPRFRLDFVGHDLEKDEDSQIKSREVRSYKTVNELRAEINLDPIPAGDVVLNALYMNNLVWKKTGMYPGMKADGTGDSAADDKGTGIVSRGDFRSTETDENTDRSMKDAASDKPN